ncbi:hypothetical protein EWM64_g4393 [Hericium alpestre]|uniref:FAD dependent oxidoreductase domain-containing protein n=1 Tax=Hericium alpestre TaxID=135208 RepID=A0A4Y9ZZJ9_9AGAM|nr:hypothetical protein EWM64_g4393 [Hericium alpestre]
MPHSTRRAALQLDFIIVGGGISGLATAYALASSGHKVRVFEAGRGLDRRAGGIRIPPNLTRILMEWGLAQQLQEKGSKYYGYMFYNRSIVRSTMLGKNDENDPQWLYGTCVYTSTLHAEDRIGDETLREFATAGSPMWAGTRQNALSYPIRQDKEYSVHFMLRQQLQDDDPEGWDAPLSPDLLTLDTCESRVKELRQHLKDVVRVRRRDRPAAKDWIDASERVILIGEAAHPVLLCGTHNCSAVVEDAAVLGSLFSRLRQQDQIEPLLYAYQDLRQYRADVLFSFDKLNRTVSQLPPGPERDERDQRLRMGQPKHEEIWDENALAIQWAGISEIWGVQRIRRRGRLVGALGPAARAVQVRRW